MAATIQDVARKAGVAIGTVSRAFNGYRDIRPETRERIFQAARELGYAPNVSARNLSAKKPPNIGLIISGLLDGNNKDSLVYLQLQGILRYATEHGLEIAMYATDSARQRRQSYTTFCAQHSISGTLLCGITTDDAYFTELMDSGIPTVAMDVAVHGENAGWVSVDNRAAAREAVEYLLEQGLRDLMIVCGKQNADVNSVRMRGVQDAFSAARMTIQESDCLHCDFSEERAYELVSQRLKHRRKTPDAIFCFSDVMALGVMRALREARLRIPEDVSVVGFDGLPLGELTVPPLSSVYQDMRAMGYEAVSMLHGIMEHRCEGGHRILPHSLLDRGSIRHAG